MFSAFKFLQCSGIFMLLELTEMAAAPMWFSIAQKPAGDALLAFSRQAAANVVFSCDDLQEVNTPKVVGLYEPAEALTKLLRNTRFLTYMDVSGRYIVVANATAIKTEFQAEIPAKQ